MNNEEHFIECSICDSKNRAGSRYCNACGGCLETDHRNSLTLPFIVLKKMIFQDWVPFFKTIWWVSFKPKRFFSGLANEKGFIGNHGFQDFSSFIVRYIAAVSILNLLIVKYLGLKKYVPSELDDFSGFWETWFFNVFL